MARRISLEAQLRTQGAEAPRLSTVVWGSGRRFEECGGMVITQATAQAMR
jgi:hypothetical protein